MQLLTVATHAEGYYPLLLSSARQYGYTCTTLGWQQPWRGLAWKLDLYLAALNTLPDDEPVLCVDGYDVIVTAPADELLAQFKALGQPLVFSGQRCTSPGNG